MKFTNKKVGIIVIVILTAILTAILMATLSKGDSIELTKIKLNSIGDYILTIGLPTTDFGEIRKIDELGDDLITNIVNNEDNPLIEDGIGYYIEDGDFDIFISKDLVVLVREQSAFSESLEELDRFGEVYSKTVSRKGNSATVVAIALDGDGARAKAVVDSLRLR